MSIRTKELDITPPPLSRGQVIAFRYGLPIFALISIVLSFAEGMSLVGVGWLLTASLFFLVLFYNAEFRAEILGQRPLILRVAVGEESIVIEYDLAGRLFRAGTQGVRFDKVWEARFYDESIEFVGSTAFENKIYVPRASLVDDAEVEKLADMLASKGIRVSRPDLAGVNNR